VPNEYPVLSENMFHLQVKNVLIIKNKKWESAFF